MDRGAGSHVVAAPLDEPVPVQVVVALLVAHRQVVVGSRDLLDADVARALRDHHRLHVAEPVALREAVLDEVTRRPVAVTDAASVLLRRRVDRPVAADVLPTASGPSQRAVDAGTGEGEGDAKRGREQEHHH